LNEYEFDSLLKSLFSFNSNPYYIPKTRIGEFFEFYDANKNGKIEFDEFEKFWNKTIKTVSIIIRF
jgi:Ca2+-binding EF-hand superfamily protein